MLLSPPVLETQIETEVETENQSNVVENQRVDKCTHKLSDESRALIIQILLQHLKKGKPGRGVMKEVAQQYQISPKTVQRLWAQAKQQMKDGISVRVIGRMKGKSCGREGLSLPVDKVSAVSPTKRRTIRALARAVSLSKSSIHRLLNRGKLKAHTNPIKPHLTEENKVKRLDFCLSKLQTNTLQSTPQFHDFYEYVHVDEKWFEMTQATQRMYLHADEEGNLHRTIQSKKHVTKVMFLAASARLRFDEDGEVLFDGKIGIFPFIFKEPAQRNSRNRPRGTLVTKPITTVNKEVYRSYMITKVISAIKEKWPADSSKRVIIQQDNARPHIACNDPGFLQVAHADGFDISLTCQPPNSPDLNVLDLGYFRAIQSLQQEKRCKTIDELVDVVTQSYYEFEPMRSNFVWLSLQYCMGEVIKLLGCNAYKIPHVGKYSLLRNGNLPKSVTLDHGGVARAQQHLGLHNFDWRQFINEDDDTHLQE